MNTLLGQMSTVASWCQMSRVASWCQMSRVASWCQMSTVASCCHGVLSQASRDDCMEALQSQLADLTEALSIVPLHRMFAPLQSCCTTCLPPRGPWHASDSCVMVVCWPSTVIGRNVNILPCYLDCLPARHGDFLLLLAGLCRFGTGAETGKLAIKLPHDQP